MEVTRILVPVDFSAPARAALAYAVSLGERFHARLDVLHVWQEPMLASDVFPARARVSDELRALVARWEPVCPIATRLVAGDPVEQILKAARDGASLIVMGRRTGDRLHDKILGSVAERVVRAAPCPVMTVRSDPSGEPRPDQ